MKKSLIKKMISAVSAVTIALTCTTAFAEVLYQNDFSTTAETFKKLPGSYQSGDFRNTVLYGRDVLELKTGISANNMQRQYGILVGDESWSEYTVQADMKGHPFLSHSLGIIFNYQDGQNYYSLTWSETGVANVYVKHNGSMAVTNDSLVRPKLVLQKGGIYGTGTMLEEAQFPNQLDPWLWHTYKISVKKGVIYVYIDNIEEPVFAYEDPGLIKGGKAGLGVYSHKFASSPGYFDNFIISK